jgi:hypothetical protein
MQQQMIGLTCALILIAVFQELGKQLALWIWNFLKCLSFFVFFILSILLPILFLGSIGYFFVRLGLVFVLNIGLTPVLVLFWILSWITSCPIIFQLAQGHPIMISMATICFFTWLSTTDAQYMTIIHEAKKLIMPLSGKPRTESSQKKLEFDIEKYLQKKWASNPQNINRIQDYEGSFKIRLSNNGEIKPYSIDVFYRRIRLKLDPRTIDQIKHEISTIAFSLLRPTSSKTQSMRLTPQTIFQIDDLKIDISVDKIRVNPVSNLKEKINFCGNLSLIVFYWYIVFGGLASFLFLDYIYLST